MGIEIGNVNGVGGALGASPPQRSVGRAAVHCPEQCEAVTKAQFIKGLIYYNKWVGRIERRGSGSGPVGWEGKGDLHTLQFSWFWNGSDQSMDMSIHQHMDYSDQILVSFSQEWLVRN